MKTVLQHDPTRSFVVLGTAPIFTVGVRSYIAHLIALAGGRNASGIATPYARYGAEALLASQPDASILGRPGPRYNDGLARLIARLHRGAR